MREVFPAITGNFAAAGAFQVHDSPDPGVHRRDVVRAAGFEQNGEALVAERFHERQGAFLQQRLAAGEFHHR